MSKGHVLAMLSLRLAVGLAHNQHADVSPRYSDFIKTVHSEVASVTCSFTVVSNQLPINQWICD